LEVMLICEWPRIAITTLVDALSEKERGRCVPGVVNSDLADARGFEQCLPFVPIGGCADRPPVGLAPDEIAVVPG